MPPKKVKLIVEDPESLDPDKKKKKKKKKSGKDAKLSGESKPAINSLSEKARKQMIFDMKYN